MTDASPSPFRRFPWVQLVFCVACLTMTAWTWMRHSYAWEVTPEAVGLHTPTDAFGAYHADLHPWLDEYAAVRGEASRSQLHDGGWHWGIQSPAADRPGEYVMIDAGTYEHVAYVEAHFDSDQTPADGEAGVWHGRLSPMRDGRPWLAVDTTASRFHPASIAGLVVGAMGVFVFGLYLRAWLRERKAAA